MTGRNEIKVNITTELLEVALGWWCPTCALPSAIKVDAVITIGRHVSVMTLTRCPECLQ